MRILVFGTFDHLHPGHRFLLDSASKRGELFVVVARDSNVCRIKEKLPLQNQEERAQAIRDAYPDATVRIGDEDDCLGPIRAIKPDLILLGYDQNLPPGISEEDLGCPTERAEAYFPEKYKSTLLRFQHMKE